MIFCGDTVFPFDETDDFLNIPDTFQNKPKRYKR